jgi:hypothetical protein
VDGSLPPDTFRVGWAGVRKHFLRRLTAERGSTGSEEEGRDRPIGWPDPSRLPSTGLSCFHGLLVERPLWFATIEVRPSPDLISKLNDHTAAQVTRMG